MEDVNRERAAHNHTRNAEGRAMERGPARQLSRVPGKYMRRMGLVMWPCLGPASAHARSGNKGLAL